MFSALESVPATRSSERGPQALVSPGGLCSSNHTPAMVEGIPGQAGHAFRTCRLSSHRRAPGVSSGDLLVQVGAPAGGGGDCHVSVDDLGRGRDQVVLPGQSSTSVSMMRTLGRTPYSLALTKLARWL